MSEYMKYYSIVSTARHIDESFMIKFNHRRNDDIIQPNNIEGLKFFATSCLLAFRLLKPAV